MFIVTSIAHATGCWTLMWKPDMYFIMWPVQVQIILSFPIISVDGMVLSHIDWWCQLASSLFSITSRKSINKTISLNIHHKFDIWIIPIRKRRNLCSLSSPQDCTTCIIHVSTFLNWSCRVFPGANVSLRSWCKCTIVTICSCSCDSSVAAMCLSTQPSSMNG
jgi:hypothetical protein